jgi:hypothetical protein
MLANVAASFPCPNSSRFREGVPRFNDSNNPLAVKLERENDPGREILLSSLSNFTSAETAASGANDKDLFKCSTR